MATHGLMGMIKKIEYAGKITRIAHIHGIGQCSNGRPGTVLSGSEKVKKHIVPVIGCNKSLHRQTHSSCERSRRNIAKISAGDGKNKLCFSPGIHFFPLGTGMEIIKYLGQKTGHVN